MNLNIFRKLQIAATVAIISFALSGCSSDMAIEATNSVLDTLNTLCGNCGIKQFRNFYIKSFFTCNVNRLCGQQHNYLCGYLIKYTFFPDLSYYWISWG